MQTTAPTAVQEWMVIAIAEYHPLEILSHNGWEWLAYSSDEISITHELYQYKSVILGASYSSTIVALVSDHPDQLNYDGHYGILWLEARYENERNECYSFEDMEDMQTAIIFAEANLLKIGMPFTPTYCFHGKDVANKKRRNDKLRRLYRLKEKEQLELDNIIFSWQSKMEEGRKK